MITQIDHIEIIVKDVKEHVEFYKKLGFNVLGWTDHHGGSVELQLPGPNQPIIEMHTVIDEENIGVNHIAFRAEDVIQTVDELKGRGIRFDKEPYRNRHTGRANARLRDPDGWRLQLCDEKRKDPEHGVREEDVKAAL
jgi:catechol 2,3-dioxygenase-like lactoylglutathione lyase family enzyme